MLSVADAQARICRAFTPLPSELVPISDVANRVLAEPLPALLDQPPAAVSAMDGYAVGSADTRDPGADLLVIGEARAGGAGGLEIGTGECARIFTGGVVPKGADAIAIQEEVQRTGDRAIIKKAVAPGTFVRRRALDFARGEVLLEAGHLLSARDAGVAAAMGHAWANVRRRPRVAIVATGDELRLPGSQPEPGQIISSNSTMLAAMVRCFGGEPVDLGIRADDQTTLDRWARELNGYDLVLTSGGASVGDHDLVQSTLRRAGFELDFWKIAMRPGKPLMFAAQASTKLIGLPGNPVSAGVCTLIFVRGAIRTMLGLDPTLSTLVGTTSDALEANGPRQSYLRVRQMDAENARLKVIADGQDSSQLAAFASADALIVRAPHAQPEDAGAEVTFIDLTAIAGF
ncbi:MAG: gephyrin-like molybdotransferase Glp [Geminicoccaceae bacterium]